MARSSVASMVNRSLGGGAVSVYSPTRRIRPTGRVANAGTASAILGGGPIEQQPRVGTTSFGGIAPQVSRMPGWTQALGGGMPGASLPGIGTTLDQIRREAGITSAPEPEEPGGFWGSGIGKALGTAVNNPIGRGVMAGLETLNYPRRVIQSSVQEVVDAVNGGDASFDDWTQQIGDESFGFDNMVPDTGNAFLDGLIGFGGDALMDPFTFIAGAGVWSGIAGRSARAGTAATARSLGVRVGKLTVEETEERIARYGFSRFNNAARQELRDQLPGMSKNILDRGYHFKVPLTGKFFQVPGTQPVDWLLSRGAGRVRDTLSRSPLGGWMRYASNPNKMRDAVTVMVTRTPKSGMNFAQAAEVINWNNGAKLAERSFSTKAAKMADNAVKALGGGNSGRVAANDLFRTAEAQGGTVIHDAFSSMRTMIRDDFGVHVPEFDGPYLPHYRLPEAQAILDAGDTAAARDFKALYKETDLDTPAESALHRELVPGKTITIGGQTHTLVDGTADELNRIWHQALPDVKTDLIDTDFAAVAQRYIKGFQDNVRTIGGIKKVLGSKAGLLHKLGDDSMLQYLSDDDIDMFASRLSAPALKNQRDQVSSTLKQFRDDTHKGIVGVGGSLGVEMRDAVSKMSTVTPQNKAILDDALRTVSDLEAQVGVGKYHDRFVDGEALHGPPGKPGKITQEYEKARKLFANLLEAKTKRFNELEKIHGRLKTQAAAEARRLETQGNVGATPIQDELRRVAAETGATAHDMEWAEKIAARLDVTNKAQGVIDARLGDSDFINLAVADNLSPKSPGALTGADTPAPPVYVGPSPAQVSTDSNAKVTQILGATDPRVGDVGARIEVQNTAVEAARQRRWQAEVNYGEAADTARRHLAEGRQYEATLKYEVERTAGKPDLLQRNVEYTERLEAFQQGELPRLQRDFDEAKQPIEKARSNFDVEARRHQELRDEQMRIARDLDARSSDAPNPPLTAAQEKELGRQRWRIVRERNKWQRTPEGVAHKQASKAHATVTKTLEATDRRIAEITGKGGRFYIDADGVMQPKFTTNEQWARDLIEHRRTTLIPERNAARARYDATSETWSRLQRGGASLESGEVKAAQREMSAAFKAWKETDYAVREVNGKLTKIKDIPDFGRISQQTDELNQLLVKQASQQARVDELANEMLTSGATLRGYEDSIAGIDSQLGLQQTARDIAAEAPATPYGAQVAATHRAEQARLDQIEAQFAAPRNWADPEELAPAPGNLGAFEGQWEDPDIRNALELVGRVDGRRRLFDEMDEVTDLANSAAAIRAASEPFTVPPVGTPAHTAVMEFSPASRGGAMGAVDRAQTVVAQTQRVLDRHIGELTEVGAVPAEFGDELFRQRLDLDRALDVHAANPTAHNRADVTAKASELGRLTEFALRYKQALEGGNEPSAGLASFILARQLDDEAVSLRSQIDIGNARLASPAGGRAELGYSRGLARMNERAVQLLDNIEKELARAKAGGDWDRASVKAWSAEFERIQATRDNIGPPANGALDDAVDSHAAHALDDLRDTNDAERIFDSNEFIDHRMQWPVRRNDELTAAIPHREAEIQSHMMSQQRLTEAVQRAQAAPDPPLQLGMVRLYRGDPVKPGMSPEASRAARAARGMDWIDQSPEMAARNQVQGRWFTPDRNLASSYPTNRDPLELNKIRYVDIPQAEYDRLKGLAGAPPEVRSLSASPDAEVLLPEGYASQVRDIPGQTVKYTTYDGQKLTLSLAEAEQNLIANADVIRTLKIDLTNKQMQQAAIEGTIDQRITLLERELGDQEIPPNPVELLNENQAIQNAATTEQRALDPGELETIASNQARVDRLNRGQPLPQSTVAEMREEVARLSKVRDDFAAVMDNDAAHVSVARDPVPFLRGVVAGGGPLNERSLAMLSDLVGPETAAAAKVWVHYLDETFAGQTSATADELAELVGDAVGTFGDNELIERMRSRAVASLAGDGTVSLDEMRDEFTDALIASANRQRGETMRETLSMQSLFGTTYVDGPQGLTPRLIDVVADEPSHQLLTARLRSKTLDLMQDKGFDPRNAYLDEVADLRTRLGRVETMRRGIDGNDEYLDVLLTGTPSAAARAEVRATLRAGSEALGTEQQALLEQGSDLLNRLDPDRATRSLEHQKQLGKQIGDTEDEMSVVQREVDRLDREAFEAERTYTERLDEAGMHLANARRKAHEARVNHTAHEAHRKQLVQAIRNKPGKSTPAMRTAIADLTALNQARRDLGAVPTPTAAAAAAPPVGPRPPTPAETLAGWGDIRTPTAAEVQAVVKMNADAKAAGTINWEWYAPHAVGSNPNRLGPIQLPAGTKAPPGYYATAAPVGPKKLANDLGIGGHVSTSGGVKNPLNAGRDLWNLGYRDAADLGGANPADIIDNQIPFQAATPPTTATVAAADQADIDAIDGYLTAYTEDLNKIEALERSHADLDAQLAQAKRNADVMGEITKNMLADGWKIHARGIGIDNPEGYAIDVALAKAIENVTEAVSQHRFWTFLDRYTAFFKTYATAKPGFHVRNAMSATFMNLVDGVRLTDMYQGAKLWRQYERNPNFLATADREIQDAFAAVAGSGAGGRFAEAGFGVDIRTGTKMYQRVMDNAVTRWNQRVGSYVEGSARLAMALNTMYRGGNAEQAMARIAKFHFDYTEMSGLDRWARRLIPFWTFMSRNLPLQLEQMFTNPRMYLQYQNLKRNMGETADPATPEYWLSMGAFTVDKHAATREAPWYIAPDLPHLQAFEPLDALARGEFDKALLSNFNPALLAPTEALLTGKKAFSGARLEGYEQTSAANPFVPLFNLITAATPLNLTAKAGSGATVVDKRAAHIARSILPPWEFAERLLDPTGKREGRTDETIYRAFGIPVRQLNEDLRRTTQQTEYFDRREAAETQAQLARM